MCPPGLLCEQESRLCSPHPDARCFLSLKAVLYKFLYPKSVLWAQCGDFYEAWGIDAVIMIECALACFRLHLPAKFSIRPGIPKGIEPCTIMLPANRAWIDPINPVQPRVNPHRTNPDRTA